MAKKFFDRLKDGLLKDFSVYWPRIFKSIIADVITIGILVGIILLAASWSQSLMSQLSGLLSDAMSQNQGTLAVRTVTLLFFNIGGFFIAIFIVFGISRHLVWKILEKGKLSMKGWGKHLLGMLVILSVGVMVLTLPFMLFSAAYNSGIPPPIAIIVLLWLMIFLYLHLYVNYQYHLTRTRKVFESFIPAFKIGFGRFWGFIPLYCVIFILFAILSLIPAALFDIYLIAAQVISWTMMLFLLGIYRHAMQNHIARSSKRKG